MAQRVYLIPLKAELVSALGTMLNSSTAGEVAIWSKLRVYGARQSAIAEISTLCSQGLNAAAFEAAGRELDHATYANLRPYVYTSTSAEEGVRTVRELRTCKNAREVPPSRPSTAIYWEVRSEIWPHCWSPPGGWAAISGWACWPPLTCLLGKG